jgi:hypothetical protein
MMACKDTKKTDFAELGPEQTAPRFVYCEMKNTSYTGFELQGEVDYYEGVSETEDAVIVLDFEYYHHDDLKNYYEYEVISPTSAFSIVSSRECVGEPLPEGCSEGWTDFYGNPLNVTTFGLDLRQSKVDEEIYSFFGPRGNTDFDQYEYAWLSIGSVSDEYYYEGLTMFLFGSRGVGGGCKLIYRE